MHLKKILRLDAWRWRESKLGNTRRLPSSDERALALPKKERNIFFSFLLEGKHPRRPSCPFSEEQKNGLTMLLRGNTFKWNVRVC
jgi:hypothetical protein